jgi:uncharacterized protein
MPQKLEDLKVAVETISEAGLEEQLSFAPEVLAEILADESLKVTRPFELAYTVDLDGSEVNVSAHLSGAFETVCCRCLKPVVHAIDLELDTLFLPAEEDMPDDLEAERDDSAVGYYRDEIELGRYLRSELVLDLPLRHLCREDCRGLCPGCGVDLNSGSCKCERPIDPRFGKLAELKNKLEKS